MPSELTRYRFGGTGMDGGACAGEWCRPAEAEAVLAKKNRRIKELEAEVQRQIQAQILFGQQFADQQARAAIGKVADRLQAAEALADAVKNGLRPADARRFVKDDPTLTILAAEAAYREASK